MLKLNELNKIVKRVFVTRNGYTEPRKHDNNRNPGNETSPWNLLPAKQWNPVVGILKKILNPSWALTLHFMSRTPLKRRNVVRESWKKLSCYHSPSIIGTEEPLHTKRTKEVLRSKTIWNMVSKCFGNYFADQKMVLMTHKNIVFGSYPFLNVTLCFVITLK